MSHVDDELDAMRTRVADAHTTCDAALAARLNTLEVFYAALHEIDRAVQERRSIGDLSEARRLRLALQAGDLRERLREATQAAERECEELSVALALLSTALHHQQLLPGVSLYHDDANAPVGTETI